MSLSPSTKLGPYEIVAPLGAGGMGEVYRAHDTRLRRDVALKILPVEVASDASRRQRFETEARAVAALNHPNIVAVFDVGTEDGISYIISELVDGKSLRGAQFELRKTVNIAVQIASGLAAAHEVGIIHRDLRAGRVLDVPPGAVFGSPLHFETLAFGPYFVPGNRSGLAVSCSTATPSCALRIRYSK